MASLHRKFLTYTLLPGILPRLKGLFASGFVHISYSMALVFQAVRLLPPDHAYLQPVNIGRFGIRHVIAEAANNLVFSRKNIDQIIVFFTILTGLVLLIAQFALLLVAAVAEQPAIAAPAGTPYTLDNILGVTSQFGHANAAPAQDIAFMILDRVFGLVKVYNSCVANLATTCTNLNNKPISDPGGNYPFPIHIALHNLLQFYSLGIFMVSVIVILYLVVTIVGETAVTGSPFGQRFNKTWAPVRLILFFALLVPLNLGTNQNPGLNGAQLITFWVAKFGSNFATNAWGKFNDSLTGTYLGQTNKLIAVTNFPEVSPLVRFMFVASTCKVAEEYQYGFDNATPRGIQAYIVRDKLSNMLMTGPDFLDFNTTDFTTARTFSNNGLIEVRFGPHNPAAYKTENGNVKAVCGTLKIAVTSLNSAADSGPGANAVQEVYYNMVKKMWANSAESAVIHQNAGCVSLRIMQVNNQPTCPTFPNNDFAQDQMNVWSQYLKANLPNAINTEINSPAWNVTGRMREAGWAGAAIWYNRVAQLNGEVTTAVFNIPYPQRFPLLQEQIAAKNRAKNKYVEPQDVFDPALGGETEAEYPEYRDRSIAAALFKAYSLWDQSETMNSQEMHKRNNAFIDGINLIFGTQGIFSMRKNPDIHPLAQLSALGRGMMEASIRNMASGLAGGTMAGLLSGNVAGLAKVLSDFLVSMGKVTIVISFILYYVLPMLPFIYFFFAVSGWIKSIFEAIVAMPLWALAHITRLDGNGIAGPGANNGYFLLMEIFLRPILITFGLLASISIFAASVNALNLVFDLLTANLSGIPREDEVGGVGPTTLAYYRGPIDQFFFSTMYVIIVYMMALGFFKMVDQVPNNILRWMGVSVATFSEAAGDPASEVSGKIYSGGSQITGQIQSGGQLAAFFGGGR